MQAGVIAALALSSAATHPPVVLDLSTMRCKKFIEGSPDEFGAFS